jgi:transposase
MVDAVGAVATALDPLRRMIEAHVMAAERLHGDDSVLRKHAERMICMV